MLSVVIPDGVAEGGQFQAMTPSGPMVVTCPPGTKPGMSIQIQAPLGVPEAMATPIGAPMVQPLPAVPAVPHTVSDTVPSIVRNHWGVPQLNLAEAYCASLPSEKAAARNYTGCKYLRKPKTGSIFGCVYAVNPCGDCLWFPFVWCLCLPIPFPFVCSCERMQNQWITRGKHGEKTGAWVIVDEERKTLASYSVVCCSQQLKAEPDCYCTKV
jgi:hypothetical protein